MQRPRQDVHFRPQNRKYEELTPKILAKTPINYRQRKLAGQSSALPANRSKPKDVNYFKMHHPTHRLQSLSKDKVSLSQEQIKNSSIYKLLQEQISSLAKRQEVQILKMQQLKKAKQKQLTQIKTEQHSIKLQIWQLRNETMELKDSIKQEKQETQRLMEQLGITEEDFDNQNFQGEDQQQNQNQNENSVQNQQQAENE